MKYTRFTLIVLVVMSLIALSVFVYRNINEKNGQNIDEPLLVQNRYETKTDTQGSVTVDVTPQISAEDRQWRFAVVLDTHSVELDQDPLQIVVLVDDQGNIFKPTAWDGPGPGGHHREGSLIFDAIIPIPKYIELKVKDIGSIPVRSFKWNIQ
jgi:hypothetical protein